MFELLRAKQNFSLDVSRAPSLFENPCLVQSTKQV